MIRAKYCALNDRNLRDFCHRLYVMPGHVSEAHCRTIPGFIPFFQHHRELHSPHPRREESLSSTTSALEPEERERDAPQRPRWAGGALPRPPTSFQPVHYATRVLVRARVLSGKTRDQRVSKVGGETVDSKTFLARARPSSSDSVKS